MPKITPEIIEAVKNEYKPETPLRIIAKKYGISWASAGNILRRNGIQIICAKRKPTNKCVICGDVPKVNTRYCRTHYNKKYLNSARSVKADGYPWKFGSYEPATLLPENYDVQPNQYKFKRIF